MNKFFSISIMVCALAFSSCKSSVKVDRTHAPAAGPAPKIQVGQYQLSKLENGLTLIVVENHKLPRVSYSLRLNNDPILEGDKSGYISMAGDLLSAGTTTRSKSQIDEEIDFIGASLNTSASGVSGNCLKKHANEFISILADVTLHPTFPADELEKGRKQLLSSLESEKTSPDALSNKIGSVMNYGVNHPYGEQMTEASINKFQREDLVNFYNQYFKPEVAYMVVVGDITFEEAKKQTEQHFASWKRGDIKDKKYDVPAAPSGNRVVFVPLSGAVQSTIDITYPIDLKPGTQDAIVANVLNNVLGGNGFQARLMQNLREDKAYTYGAYSSISPDEVVGSFSAGASVRNEVTDSSVTQILFEMERIVNELIPDSTLQLVKNILTGNFARSLESPQTVATFAYNIQKYNLPADYYETYLQKLNAVTSADLQAMAKRVIKPGNAFITVVGNKDIADKLARFAASGKVEIRNADGSEFVDLKPAPSGVTVKSVLENYIKSIGGKEAIAKVKSFEQIGTMNMSGMELAVNMKMKDLTKFKMNVSMGAMDLMSQVMNGEKGYMAQMGQKEPMDEAMIADVRQTADLLSTLNYESYGMTANLLGINVLNGEEVYVIEFKRKDGTSVKESFGMSSGLKLLGESVDADGMISTSQYKEYITSSGVKFPSKLVQSAQGQEVVFIIKEIKINPKLDDKEFSID
jgi:zinc protease